MPSFLTPLRSCNSSSPFLFLLLSLGLRFNGEVVTRSLLARFTAALPNVRAFNLYSISECHEVTAGTDWLAAALCLWWKCSGLQKRHPWVPARCVE